MLQLFIEGNFCNVYYVQESERSVFHDGLLRLKRDDVRKHTKLVAFIKSLADNGSFNWKGNDKRYKRIENYRGFEIWEIKIPGIRVLDIEIPDGSIILLNLFKKKQDEYDKRNDQDLLRSEKLVDVLLEEGII